MIDPETRKAVCLMHAKGVSIHKISQHLKLARNTVRAIIEQKGEISTAPRSDRIAVDPKLLQELYAKCDGWKERMHEILKERGIEISYQTLTLRVRELGLGSSQARCSKVDDEPGLEMQNDTSPYRIKIGDKRVDVVASVLYFRYCKQRYLKFYCSFTRFQMKCFFHEALTFFDYAAKTCIIDNTNLAVSHGTGANAVMHLEMALFLERYGSRFVAHEIGHSNRKAGNERSFWTLETNFFPGREFESFEDLNHQALVWATEKMASKPQTENKIVPNTMFDAEKPFLKNLLPHLPRPYQTHQNRNTDQYGYVAFNANYYWVPGESRHPVTILEYADSIKIFHQRREMAEYALPPVFTKNKRIKPDGVEGHFPKHQKRPTADEERELRGLSTEVAEYLDFVLEQKGLKRHIFIQNLHRLSRRGNQVAFTQAVARALHFRVLDLGAVERMFIHFLNATALPAMLPEIDAEYIHRDSFRDGESSENPDLSQFDNLL